MVSSIDNNLNKPYAASFNLFNQAVQRTAHKTEQNKDNTSFAGSQTVQVNPGVSVNPYVNVQPVTEAKATSNQGGQYEKYSQYENNLQGKRGEIPNQYMGMYKGKENTGNLLAYC